MATQGRTLTTAEKKRFLKSLRETGGNVRRACQLIGLTRGAVYDHRKRDPDFAEEFEDTIEAAIDDMEQEARRRAMEGVEKPVYQNGTLVGHIQQYSDTLMIFLLKAYRPDKFRDRMDMTTSLTGTLDMNIQQAIDRIYGDNQIEVGEISDEAANIEEEDEEDGETDS